MSIHSRFNARPRRHPDIGARHRAFAARLGARRVALAVTAPARVLRRSWPGIQMHAATLQLSFHAALHSGRPSLASPSAAPAPAQILLPVQRMQMHRTTLRVLQSVRHTRHLQYAGAARVSVGAPTHRVAITHRMERQPGFPPIVLTMARSTARAASTVPETASAPGNVLPRGERGKDTARQAVAPLVLPQPELNRVTEHVIQQLDRRVLSYRERMGQV